MAKELDYDNVNWSEFFYCDPSSESGLMWNITSYSLRGNKLEIWPGKQAGTLSDVKNGSNKAWRVQRNVDGKSRGYQVHRIIAVLSGMKVNGKVIDHINGISADNTLANLRVTDIPTNARNCRVQDNSPYGVTGVGYQEDKNKNAYFIARSVVNGDRVQKSFPIKRLGVMESFKQACLARQRFISELNAIGAGYTERHSPVGEFCNDYAEYVVSKEEYAKSFQGSKKNKNNSLPVGVCVSGSSGYTVFVAFCDSMGTSNRKSFPVIKHGLLPAHKMAVEARIQMELELHGKEHNE